MDHIDAGLLPARLRVVELSPDRLAVIVDRAANMDPGDRGQVRQFAAAVNAACLIVAGPLELPYDPPPAGADLDVVGELLDGMRRLTNETPPTSRVSRPLPSVETLQGRAARLWGMRLDQEEAVGE